ncbi:Ig-like domain-containing protein [Dyadobacter sandarakinus]|uniref:T9SS type A sorting domain-containing protein n=1 Tax=Dyadobacter sandarakinus TaxID=2747268 RepID=A0ABX7I913_9BACT|nr:Ig-like domain-containing protein [Dyadobacter sandarakinus]QRR01461.1 T9SS type A sorting domain-containing protein [Dyadobacter sandarakinus]
MKKRYFTKKLYKFLFIVPILFVGISNVKAALSAGDLAVIGMNGDTDPATSIRSFAVVALNDIAAQEVIYFTDRGWVNAFDATPGHFVGALGNPPLSATYTNEGTFQWKPSASIPKGTVIVFKIDLATRTVSGMTGGGTALPSPDLMIQPGTWINTTLSANPWPATIGDQILIYQGTIGSPSFIFAFNNLRSTATNVSNGWYVNPDNTEPTTSFPIYSELPASLPANCSLGFLTNPNTNPRYPNAKYNPGLKTSGSKADWLEDITDPTNWNNTTTANTPYNFRLGFGSGNLTEFGFPAAAPVVTASNISISGATGTNGAFRIGDVVTATWNNTANGDNNTGITEVTIDFGPFGGTSVSATNNAQTWTATYTIISGDINGVSNLNVSVTAAAGAGNSSTVSGASNETVDNQAPSVAITSSAGASGGFTYNSPIPVTITFSETVTGFDANDVLVSNGAISGFSGSGTTYTFDLIPATYGIVTVNVADNVADDPAANANTAALPFEIDYQVNLPVSLIRYTAIAEGNAAKIEWSTATETDNSHFEIEHATDAKNFTVIGLIEASGNSMVNRNYSWYDKSPANGKNYYRLVQVDYDGTTTRYGIKSLTFGASNEVLAKVYPNPAVEKVMIALPENTRIAQLLDAYGKILCNLATDANQTEITVPVDNLSPGIYLIHLITASGIQSGKFVKF